MLHICIVNKNIQGEARVTLISLQGGAPLWTAAWAASDAVEDQDDHESCSLSRWP